MNQSRTNASQPQLAALIVRQWLCLDGFCYFSER